jgi:hypothetical protein
MPDAPEPEVKLPEGFQVGSILATPIPDEMTFPLRSDQFQILCSGDTSEAKSGMYFCIGLFVSALLGLFSLFQNTDWPGFWAAKRGMLLVYFGCGLAIAAGSTAGFFICLFLLKRKNSPYSMLLEKIARHFEPSQNAEL